MKGRKELVLEVGKTYLTRSGRKARIICNDLQKFMYKVVAAISDDCDEFIQLLTEEGRCVSGKERDNDIVEEYSFWNDVEVDTPIFVSHVNELSILKRHFAKYENGNVFFFEGGNTSWSTRGILSFFDKTKDVRLATKEEIEKI